MKLHYLLPLILLLSACSGPDGNPLQQAEKEVPTAAVPSPKEDTLVPEPAPSAVEKKTEPVPQPEAKTKQPVAAVNDTTYHYYEGGRLSVKITPWTDYKRYIWLYDLKGNKTYTFQDVRREYSTITSLKFHPNGAVSVASTSQNPGASMYMYHTSTTFGTGNEPQWQTKTQTPQKSLEMPDKYYWDENRKDWVKQEIVREQPVPEEFRK